MKPPAFIDREVRYKCGTCGYDRFEFWSKHQHHYENHLRYEKKGRTDGF